MPLILGTAEFNPAGYAGKPCPDEKEIVRILNLAWESGVRMLDCADTYGTEHLEKYFGGFGRINKTRKRENFPSGRPLFYHYEPGEKSRGYRYASIYEPDQMDGLYEAIVPLNINNTEFVGIEMPCTPYIRSVFDRGRLLEQGYSVKDCLSFAKRHYNKGIIVGVNSVKELEEILSCFRYGEV